MESDNWLFCPKPNPYAKVRLFCFPYAGGGTVPYFHWPKYLTDDIELLAIRLPGRESRKKEKPYKKINPLIDAIYNNIVSYLDMPYAFFGHSMGAHICFELIRKIRKEKLVTPKIFFVSSSKSPHLLHEDHKIYLLPDDELIIKLKMFSDLPDKILTNIEVLKYFLPIFRADLEMFHSYRYYVDIPFECPIIAFSGKVDTKVSWEQISAWKIHTKAQFKLNILPGGHFYLNNERKTLLNLITRDLKNVHNLS